MPSVPGLLASSLGRLMVEPFEVPMPHGGSRMHGGYAGIGQWAGTRYIYRLRGRTYKVARLVCEAFHGQPPAALPYCLHVDEDARNNRPSNLRWGTQKENLNAPGFLAYCASRTGDNSPVRKGLALRKGVTA